VANHKTNNCSDFMHCMAYNTKDGTMSKKCKSCGHTKEEAPPIKPKKICVATVRINSEDREGVLSMLVGLFEDHPAYLDVIDVNVCHKSRTRVNHITYQGDGHSIGNTLRDIDYHTL